MNVVAGTVLDAPCIREAGHPDHWRDSLDHSLTVSQARLCSRRRLPRGLPLPSKPGAANVVARIGEDPRQSSDVQSEEAQGRLPESLLESLNTGCHHCS